MNINHLEQALDGETPIRTKKTEQPLAVTGANTFSVTITPDAEQRKADALAMAGTIKTVRSATEQADAIAAASILKGLVSGMEKTRVEVKKPVLAAGREIDDVAKLYSGAIERELKRVEALAADWQREEQRRLDIIRQEQERLNREAEEAANAERRAYLAIIAKAQDEQQREAAQRAADEAAEANAEAARQRQQAMLAVAAPKVEGASVRRSMDFELLNIHELYRARPDLVTLEPRTALIKAALAIPGTDLPGVRGFESVRVLAKASL